MTWHKSKQNLRSVTIQPTTQIRGNAGVILREGEPDQDFKRGVDQQEDITIHIPESRTGSRSDSGACYECGGREHFLESASMSRDSISRVHSILWKLIKIVPQWLM